MDLIARAHYAVEHGSGDALHAELVAEVERLQKLGAGWDTPDGWIVAGHTYNDSELPAPFDSIGHKSSNIGASVWIHVASGAMVAALPTGRWDEPAQFAFYFAWRNATSAFRMKGWCDDQAPWSGSHSDDYSPYHERAIAYFNSTIQSAART